MVGTNPDFNGAEFREGIRQAMLMATPVGGLPLFHFAETKQYAGADDAGNPFNWAETPTVTGKQPRRELCLVDTHDKPMPIETPIGPFRPDQPDLYMFEDEWARVSDFESVDIAGVTYERVETLQPVTMFDVTLHHVRVKVEDNA